MTLPERLYSKLIIGTAQFGQCYGVANSIGRVNSEAAKRILSVAKLHRIRSIDTASAYGESETILGAICEGDWRLVSKVPPVPLKCNDVVSFLSSSVLLSLRRLKRNNIYSFLIHEPAQLFGPSGKIILDTLIRLKERGLFTKLGVSIYCPSEVNQLMQLFPFDIVQLPYSIFDQRFQTSGQLERLKSENVELHVRSVFLQGLLLASPSDRPKYFHKWPNIWSKWDGWLLQNAISPIEACMGYALANPLIDNIIVGVESCQQLNQIVMAITDRPPCMLEFCSNLPDELLDPRQWRV